MKKITLFVVILIGFCIIFLTAQRQNQTQMQVTKFAVVNFERIQRERFENRSDVQQLRANRQAIQTEVNELAAEIQELHESRAEAQRQQNSNEIWRLDTEITNKTGYLRNYAAEKDAEFNAAMGRLQQGFSDRVREAAERVAISEGVTMVLDINAPGVVWFSNSVNITADVIQALR